VCVGPGGIISAGPFFCLIEKSALPKFALTALTQFFLRHGFILEDSDFGERTSRRFVHCRVRTESKENKLLFAKVARSPELANNLGREILYFVFIFYPKYSRPGREYRRNFRRLVDWILEVANS